MAATVLAGIALASASALPAAAQEFIGATDNTWGTSANWNPSTVPDAPGADVSIGTSGTQTVDLGANTYTVGGLTISNGSTLQNGTLTLNNDGSAATITVGPGDLDYISTDVVLADDTIIDNAGNQLMFSGAISGTKSLIFESSAFEGVALYHANSYSGGTIIRSNSNVQINSSASLGTGPVTFNGSNPNSALLISTAPLTINNALGVADNSFGDIVASDANPFTVAGPLSLGASSTLLFNYPQDNFEGTVAITSSSVTAYATSSIQVRSGVLDVTGSSAMTAALGTISQTRVDSGSTLLLGSGTTRINNLGGFGTIADGTASSATLATTGNSRIGGTLSDGTAGGTLGLSVTGGTLTLTGHNTYTGDTDIQAGTVLIRNADALGQGARAVDLQSGAELVGDFTGSLAVPVGYGKGTRINENTRLSAGTGHIFNIQNADYTYSGDVLNFGSAGNDGTVQLSYTYYIPVAGLDLNVDVGTMRFGNQGTADVFGDAMSSYGDGTLSIDAGAAFDLNGLNVSVTELDGAGKVKNGVADGAADMLTVAEGSFSGVISGETHLKKNDTGTLTLSGTNTYTGGTTVSEGVLSVSADDQLGDASGGLTFDGGTLRVTGTGFTGTDRTITWDDNGGTFDIADPDNDFTLTQDWSNPDGLLGKTGAGTLTLTGDVTTGLFDFAQGTVAVTGDGELSRTSSVSGGRDFVGRQSGDDAAFLISDGGVVSTANAVQVGAAAGATGRITVTGEGSSLLLDGFMVLGNKGTGTLTVESAGRVATNHLHVGVGNPGDTGTGTVTVAGDDSVVESEAALIGGFSNGSTGTVTLRDGGTLRVSGAFSMAFLNPDGSAAVNIGTASTDPADAVAPGTLDATTLDFYEDSANLTFNHTGERYGFDTALQSRNPGAGFINHYAGTTLLTGDSSGFSGNTTIQGGTLAVNGALGGTVAVEDGGTLGGSGTVGASNTVTTVASGGTIAPGNSIGTLTVAGDLMLNDGAFLDYELGGPGTAGDPAAGISDRIAVAGGLTLDGTLDLSQSGDAADGTTGVGYYRLITYGGTLTDHDLEIGETPALADPAAYEIQAGGGNVDLFIAALGDDTLQHWQGGDGTWNAANTKWFNQGGTVPVAWAGNTAIFKDQPGGFDGGTITVNGTQSFKGLQFVDEGYRLDGPGALETVAGGSEIRVLADRAEIATKITGTGGIAKTEAGTLVLTGTNSYTGGTTISGGTLSVSADANLGDASGGLTFAGGTLSTTADFASGRAVRLASDGLFDVASGTTLGLSGAVSGAGDLVKQGAGTLQLAGANSYGGTRIQAGRLIGDAGSISGDVANAGSLVFDQGTDATFAGTIGGTGSLTKTSSGSLTLTNANSSYEGGTVVDAGTLIAAATGVLGTGDATLDDRAELHFSGNGVSAGDRTLTAESGSYLSFENGATGGAATIDIQGDARGFATTVFNQTSTAGQATITNGGVNAFGGRSTAGRATIANRGGSTVFGRQSTAGQATIVNDIGGSTGFGGRASAGQADITNNDGGVTSFLDTSTASGATITNKAGGTVDVSGHSGGIGIGSVSGAGDIALGGNALTLGALGKDDAIGGVIEDGGAGGSLVKGGSGILTLTGTNTYTGDTTVAAGSLAVDGSIAGDATVASGTTLGGSGSIGGTVTVADGGTLAGATGQTLGLGSLALSAGSNVDVALGAPSNAALFDVGGDLTLDGTLNVSDAGGFGAGIYRLFDYGGTLTDNGLAIGATPGGAAASDLFVQTSAASQINLVDTAGRTLSFWDGGNAALHDNGAVDGGSGTWQAGDRNWTGMNGTVNGPYQPNPTLAVFEGGGGTVTVDDDAGAISVTGMQFASDGYRVTGDAVGLAGPEAAIRVGNGTQAGVDYTATIASALAGESRLTKTDLGTLMLTGANTYTGGTAIEAGTLIGDAASIREDVANAGSLVFEQEADATFAGTIGGLNGVDGTVTKQGVGTLTLSGASTLDWSARNGGLVSAADRFTGDVAIGQAGSFTFDQTDDGIYAGAISGSGGSFVKSGAGTLTLNGQNPYSGPTTVAAGKLVVGDDDHGSASLASTITVADGAALGGKGTISGLVAGGTVAPGNSIGTLDVAGGITFAPGSIYEVEVDPAGADSDLIHAAGAAQINGGVVRQIGLDGIYGPKSTYTILTADGGVSGTFDSVGSDYAFLDAALGYDATDVTLTLSRNDIDFADIGNTRNQRATAGGIQSLGFGNDIYDTVIGLDAPTAREAFDGLSGESHASAKSGLLDDSRYVRDAVNRRTRQAFAVGAPRRAMLAGAGDARTPTPDGVTFWTEGFGTWGSLDGNAASLDRSTSGVFLGADAPLGESWRVGVAGGYSRANFDVDNRASSADIDSYHIAAYAGARIGRLGLRFGAAYAWNDIDTGRSIGFSGLSDYASADYRSRTAQIFGEAGYDLSVGQFALEPFAGLAYVDLDSDGFQEHGGVAALRGYEGSDDIGFSTLGMRAATEIGAADGAAITVRGMLGWRHAYGDVTPETQLAFDGGSTFAVSGVPIARDALAVEAGLDAAIGHNITLGLSYTGQIGDGAQDHGIKGNLSWKF